MILCGEVILNERSGEVPLVDSIFYVMDFYGNVRPGFYPFLITYVHVKLVAYWIL